MSLPKPLIPPADTPPNPFDGVVSIIIPTFNCAATLPRSIRSLQAQTYRNIEIIVSDDASTDDTCALVTQFDVRYVRSATNRGAAVARNNGAKIARGEIYLFAEADGYYDDDYVEKIIRYLHLPGVAAGINVGRRVWTDRDNVLVRHQNDLLQAAADRVRAGKRGTGGWAFPKGVFWAVNGYDPECRIGQDVDLVRRVVEAVGRTVLGGESVLYHKDPDTLRTYMKRAHRGAYFSGRFREKWHGGAGLVKKLAYTAKFAALAAWPLYVIPALGVHPIFWLPFAAVPAYLLFEDLTTWDGWRLTWRRGDVATALATPVLLYLRRLAIGVGRLRSFFA